MWLEKIFFDHYGHQDTKNNAINVAIKIGHKHRIMASFDIDDR